MDVNIKRNIQTATTATATAAIVLICKLHQADYKTEIASSNGIEEDRTKIEEKKPDILKYLHENDPYQVQSPLKKDIVRDILTHKDIRFDNYDYEDNAPLELKVVKKVKVKIGKITPLVFAPIEDESSFI